MNTIKNLIAKLRGEFHVDGILASVHSTIARLEALAVAKEQEAAAHAKAVVAATEARIEANAQVVRAKSIIERIRGLVG